MEKFTILRGVAAPLMRRNVDTDVIIPIDKMIQGDRETLGRSAFYAWRTRADGSEDPDFVLNQRPYRDAKILLAGDNFGCGSSREGAVWAIQGMGIRCVIAPSFGAIFFNNCFQNGALPVVLPSATVEAFAAQATATPEAPFTVDLGRCRITAPNGEEVAFEVDPVRRQALLEGLDDIALTLRRDSEIAAFQEADRARRPWVYL
ncbi:MAG: 3-isopropylmalate dehydratase small subunit [Kiloniellales bacterium]